MTELLFKEEVCTIVGAAMAVYNELGSGFLEAVYQEALKIELHDRGIPFESQKELRILYKGRPLKKSYNCDLLCFGKLIVELKSEERLTNKDRGQIHNYLKATGLEVGLLFRAVSRLIYGCASLRALFAKQSQRAEKGIASSHKPLLAMTDRKLTWNSL